MSSPKMIYMNKSEYFNGHNHHSHHLNSNNSNNYLIPSVNFPTNYSTALASSSSNNSSTFGKFFNSVNANNSNQPSKNYQFYLSSTNSLQQEEIEKGKTLRFESLDTFALLL